MALSEKTLRRRGVSADDIKTAKIIQGAQRRQHCKVQTINQIITGVSQIKPGPADLTVRQLRKRGRIGQAALLLDQEAIGEQDLVKQTRLRFLSREAKILAEKPAKLEFDFFRGNWSVAEEYHDTIRERIHALPLSVPKRMMAIAVMAEVIRWLPWEDAACSKTAAEIADLLKIRPIDVSTALKTLEEVGAIRRAARGRTKLIYVNPEGAYRGNVNHHATAVADYAKTMKEAGNVIPLRQP